MTTTLPFPCKHDTSLSLQAHYPSASTQIPGHGWAWGLCVYACCLRRVVCAGRMLAQHLLCAPAQEPCEGPVHPCAEAVCARELLRLLLCCYNYCRWPYPCHCYCYRNCDYSYPYACCYEYDFYDVDDGTTISRTRVLEHPKPRHGIPLVMYGQSPRGFKICRAA